MKDGERYPENPDFVWVEAEGKWVYSPPESEEEQ